DDRRCAARHHSARRCRSRRRAPADGKRCPRARGDAWQSLLPWAHASPHLTPPAVLLAFFRSVGFLCHYVPRGANARGAAEAGSNGLYVRAGARRPGGGNRPLLSAVPRERPNGGRRRNRIGVSRAQRGDFVSRDVWGPVGTGPVLFGPRMISRNAPQRGGGRRTRERGKRP